MYEVQIFANQSSGSQIFRPQLLCFRLTFLKKSTRSFANILIADITSGADSLRFAKNWTRKKLDSQYIPAIQYAGGVSRVT